MMACGVPAAIGTSGSQLSSAVASLAASPKLESGARLRRAINAVLRRKLSFKKIEKCLRQFSANVGSVIVFYVVMPVLSYNVVWVVTHGKELLC